MAQTNYNVSITNFRTKCTPVKKKRSKRQLSLPKLLDVDGDTKVLTTKPAQNAISKRLAKPKKSSSEIKKVNDLQCKYCKEILQTQKLFDLHKKQHIKETDLQLRQDNEKEPSYRFDAMQDLYICDVCSAEFRILIEVEEHIKEHAKRMNCPDCNETFKTAHDLGIHSAKHDPNRKYHCPLCPYICAKPKPSILKAHINFVHLKLFPYNCSTCTKSFKYLKTYKEHLDIHVGKRPYVCIVCNKGFPHKQYLHLHQIRNHQVGITGNKIENQCSTCSRYFYKPEALKEHLIVCNKKEKNPKIDKSIRPFLCDFCGQTFAKNTVLLKHLTLHKGDLPFVCTWCGKRFPLKPYLKCHERVHTGEKPYSCEFCDKRFSNHAPLRVHRRMHTGEKPYVCDFCNKGYKTNQLLKIHKRNCSGKADIKIKEEIDI